jgi:hypothetical protein
MVCRAEVSDCARCSSSLRTAQVSLANCKFSNTIRELAIAASDQRTLPLVVMSDVFLLLFHLLTTLVKLIKPGGHRTVIAENLLLKQQLIIHSRSRQRSPNLSTQDRTLLGFFSQAHFGLTQNAH